MTGDTNCTFSNPENYMGASPVALEPFQFTTMTCSSAYSTTTPQNFVGGFSYGEAMTVFLLFLLAAMIFFKQLKELVLGVKIEDKMRRTTLKYNDTTSSKDVIEY